MISRSSKRALLLAATVLAGTPAFAQEQPGAVAASQDALVQADTAGTDGANGQDDIIVTATRRSVSLQDAPINIAAIGAQALQDQRIDDVRDLGNFTPGVTVLDTGPRNTGSIVMRGISSGDTSTGGANTSSAVATYLGEVPLYLDFKLIDIQRVEVLLGPQGTLYGSGTLSGAIRYIPRRPDASPGSFGGEVHARGFGKSHSSTAGYDADVAVNLPILEDHIALRAVMGYYYDPGFIDSPLILATPGVSLAQPGGKATAANYNTAAALGTTAQQAANFAPEKDLNFERTFTSRSSLLLQPNDNIKAYLTYAFQQTNTNGRQANSAGVLGTGKYENAFRYKEPSKRQANLLSLEIEANLFDIAQLVSATGITKQTIRSQGDNSDLLLDLDYGYETFPAFSSFAPSVNKYKQVNQEVRLVSTHGGPFSWVLGGFYNKFKNDTVRNEYIPGYAKFRNNPRLDDLEYASFTNTKTEEKAIFGEATFKISDAWQVTGGGRYFKYDASVTGGTELPFTGGGRTRSPYPLVVFQPVRVRSGSTKDDGFIWKANTSYKFSDTLLVYGTYSKGYRIGGVNRVAPCIQPLAPGQNLCALPDELVFGPDKTTNKEIGVRAQLFDRRLTTNLAVFHIDWSGVQVPSQTVNGAIGITANAAKAVSKGVEFSGSLRVTDAFTLAGTYAYNDAHLTKDAPGLSASTYQIENPLTLINQTTGKPIQTVQYDALKGDRLPGSTKNSGTASATYTFPVTDDGDLIANWTAIYRGGVYSRTGLRGFGERIPSYVTHRANLTYRTKGWEVSLFANNIFDKYAVVSVGNTYTQVGVNDGQALRYYNKAVLNPRVVGVETRFKF